MSLNIKAKLLISFSIVVLLTVITGLAGIHSVNSVNKMVFELNENALPGVNYARSIDTDTSDYRAALRKHALSTTEKDLNDAEQEMAMATDNLDKNKKEYEKTITTEEGRNKYQSFLNNWDECLGIARQIMSLSREQKNQEAQDMLNNAFLPAYNKNQESVNTLVEFKIQRADQIYNESQSQYKSAVGIVTAVILFAVLIGFILAFIISRNIANGLNMVVEAADKVARGDLTSQDIAIRGKDEIARLSTAFNKMKSSLKDIINQMVGISLSLSESSQQLASQAEQTSSAASENAATVEEIASTVEHVAQDTQEISTSANEASQNASEGINGINKINAQMNSIITSSDLAVQVIDELSVTLGRVNQIVDLITHIADQTNLLALNAAIEAARAGEQGRGFAVVAEEVRKLAEQSAGAAKEINQLITQVHSESQKAVATMAEGNQRVKEGAEVAGDVGENIKGIIDVVESLSNQIQNVAASAQQVSAGVQNVASTTEEQTAAMEEVSAATEQLNMMANNLDELAKRFKV
ncbi:methyl-accepting chemotaxis protein [Desulfocucumis palustris]|uniref:Methyl-accepting chemotaxis protein n=1 Tax=Desulfocucumis palustris TaxID=1898651 RepID=A0A2L2XCD9_9FIRM|nr:methyl-accepting chemotaxis protein [Desulfocucumis palustris]GBF33999.1 methyl-accepting chemotaxis protein [Desulfocucumis palustris]